MTNSFSEICSDTPVLNAISAFDTNFEPEFKGWTQAEALLFVKTLNLDIGSCGYSAFLGGSIITSGVLRTTQPLSVLLLPVLESSLPRLYTVLGITTDTPSWLTGQPLKRSFLMTCPHDPDKRVLLTILAVGAT